MEKSKYNTNAMVEAAFMAVFIIVIIIITGYVPVLSYFGTLILPIPIAVLFLRQNFKITISCIVVSTVITALMFNPIVSISSAISYSLVGLTLGYCIKNKKSSYFTIMLLTLACILTTIITAGLFLVFVEKTSLVTSLKESMDMIIGSFQASAEEIKGYYANMGISSKQLEQMDKSLALINIENMLIFLPSSILAYSFISAYVNYVVSMMILKRLKYEVKEVLHFSEFYVSNLIGAVLIGLTCIGIILSGKNVHGAQFFYKAVFAVMGVVFLLNGIAATVYFLRRKRLLSKRVTFLLIFFSFIFGLGYVYFTIGFAEMILDFRRLDPYRMRKV